VGKATVELAWRIICLRMRMFHLTENSKYFIVGWSTVTVVGRNYTNLYLYQRAVRSSVSAVRKHCVNTNRYKTTHKLYTMHLTRTYSKQQTPRSTVLLEKPTAPQPVIIYGTGRFIAVCTTDQHLSLS